jgi:demethylmenaquinone methyltransferase/2-methoxy-6-polyprenyl-1,4-benzoquinol methylase
MGCLENQTKNSFKVLPVKRPKTKAKKFYNRISQYYDFLAGPFERKYTERGLKLISIKENQSILEIGFGTGHSFKIMVDKIGSAGSIVGIDFSSGMVITAKQHLDNTKLRDYVNLCIGDAGNLPFRNRIFEVIFIAFTLELFDTPEIQQVLSGIKRVLMVNGRFGIVSLSKKGGSKIVIKIYEWAHRIWPVFFDCRPIYLEESLLDANFKIIKKKSSSMVGLSVELAVAKKNLSC